MKIIGLSLAETVVVSVVVEEMADFFEVVVVVFVVVVDGVNGLLNQEKVDESEINSTVKKMPSMTHKLH